MARVIALLRGINVGGQRTVPMAELRRLATAAGFAAVETCIQSGNLVLTTAVPPATVEATLERAIARRFGFEVEVIARTAAAWGRIVAGNPFAAAARDRPNHLLLVLSKRPPSRDAATQLQVRATLGERVEVRGDAVWVDYARGVGRSKLNPAVLDRAVGSTVTARNWTTVLRLAEMATPGGP